MISEGRGGEGGKHTFRDGLATGERGAKRVATVTLGASCLRGGDLLAVGVGDGRRMRVHGGALGVEVDIGAALCGVSHQGA